MSQFVLTSASVLDKPQEFFEENQIPFVCYHFTMDDKEYDDDLGKSMPIDEFYQRISDGAMPTTSQPSELEYMELFEPFLQEGKDVLHLAFSSGLSGGYRCACLARDELQEKYPQRKLYVVDSAAASAGHGLLAKKVTELRDENMSIEEVRDWLEENKLRLHHWFFSTDLTSFYRGGRISKASAVFGTALHICPLMNVNYEGELVPREKYRGKKRVMQEMVKKMEQFADDGMEYSEKCYISHSACPEDAQQVAELIEQRFPHLDGSVEISSIGTVIGAHTGPGTVALFFWGKPRRD